MGKLGFTKIISSRCLEIFHMPQVFQTLSSFFSQSETVE